MSENENEEYEPKKKVIDVNVNVGQQAKKEVTDKDAQALAEQLSEIIGEDVTPAKYVSEYEDQKRRLHTELAIEIGSRRSERSRKQALERTSYPTASGQSQLSAEQATGEQEFEGECFDENTPIRNREYSSVEQMLRDLSKTANNPDSPYKKDAQNALIAYGKKHQKSREGMLEAELQNVGDVARGKKPMWKIKKRSE